MPRVKAEPKKCIKTNLSEPNSWVFIVKGENLEIPDQYTGTGTPDIVTLRHPNSREGALFLFSPTNSCVQEIVTLNDVKRSWFIGDTLQSDGKMHLSTPIDPIFLVLPYLKKCGNSCAMSLDDIIFDEEFPETVRLLQSSGLKYLHMVADNVDEKEKKYYKYNEDKTLIWLKKKTERVAEVLKQKNIHVGDGVASATFIKSNRNQSKIFNENAISKKNESDVIDSDYLKYAHGIISEYLTEDLSEKLLVYLNLDLVENISVSSSSSSKRKTIGASSNSSVKKMKMDIVEKAHCSTALDLTSPVKISKVPIQSSKDKARAKAAAGSKNISAFFKKS